MGGWVWWLDAEQGLLRGGPHRRHAVSRLMMLMMQSFDGGLPECEAARIIHADSSSFRYMPHA